MSIMVRSKGFTIVELLIVIVVIGVLAAITTVAYTNMQGRARYSKVVSELAGMQKLIEMYKTDNGTYPPTGGGFRYQRVSGNGFIPGIVPAYASSLPQVTDSPYGGTSNDTYIYSSNSTATGYVIQRLYQPDVPQAEWTSVPASMKQSSYTDRYGYGNNLAGY